MIVIFEDQEIHWRVIRYPDTIEDVIIALDRISLRDRHLIRAVKRD